jgi:hypothetical protein
VFIPGTPENEQFAEATADAIRHLLDAAASSSESLRRAWERLWGRRWPKDPETGRNQDAHHRQPRADGGTDDPENIDPLPHKDHVEHHKNRGDFKRWGKRAQSNMLSPGSLTPGIGGALAPSISGAIPLGGRK